MSINLCSFLGFVKENPIEVKYQDTFEHTDNLDLKTDYLKEIDSQENSRHSSIETKTSQLIGQTGIIFTLIGLFISNYIAKFSEWPGLMRAILLGLFVVSLFFYLLTIFQATKYLNILKYKYGQRSPSTVSKKFESPDAFKIEEIKDLLYSIERNTLVTNQKCNNLIYAYRSFKIATVTVGLLSVLLIICSSYLPSAKPTKVSIENQIGILGLDSILIKLQKDPGKNIQLLTTPKDTASKSVVVPK